MSVPCIFPDIEGDCVLDYLWLRPQDPQASQNVVGSLSEQVLHLDIEEKLEVHRDGELHKDPQNPQGFSLQAMMLRPHEDQTLSTSQPPIQQQSMKQPN